MSLRNIFNFVSGLGSKKVIETAERKAPTGIVSGAKESVPIEWTTAYLTEINLQRKRMLENPFRVSYQYKYQQLIKATAEEIRLRHDRSEEKNDWFELNFILLKEGALEIPALLRLEAASKRNSVSSGAAPIVEAIFMAFPHLLEAVNQEPDPNGVNPVNLPSTEDGGPELVQEISFAEIDPIEYCKQLREYTSIQIQFADSTYEMDSAAVDHIRNKFLKEKKYQSATIDFYLQAAFIGASSGHSLFSLNQIKKFRRLIAKDLSFQTTAASVLAFHRKQMETKSLDEIYLDKFNQTYDLLRSLTWVGPTGTLLRAYGHHALGINEKAEDLAIEILEIYPFGFDEIVNVYKLGKVLKSSLVKLRAKQKMEELRELRPWDKRLLIDLDRVED